MGEYSRVLLSGLYINQNKMLDFRGDIPIDTRTFGFSMDVFVAMGTQDIHVKLDMRILVSLDASYIDGEIWLDLIQPYAQRKEFPMLWSVTELQRNRKSCLDKDVLEDVLELDIPTVTTSIESCFGYTWDRRLFYSLSFIIGSELGSITMAQHAIFQKELHVASFHVAEGEDLDPRLGVKTPLIGITAGDLAIVDSVVCKNMNEARERTTWELARMVVQLKRDQLALAAQVENLTRTSNELKSALEKVSLLSQTNRLDMENHVVKLDGDL